MQKSWLGRFLDNLSLGIAISIILFAWIKRLIKNNLISLILSIIITFFIIKVIHYFQTSKLRKLNIEKDELKHIETCNFELRKMQKSNQLQFFKKLLPHLKFKQKNYMLISNNILITIELTKNLITEENVFEIYHKVNQLKNKDINHILIVCNAISLEAQSLLKSFHDYKLEILSPIEIYSLMKLANMFPIEKTEKMQIKTKKPYFSNIFFKKSAKIFIRCGILLYLSSLFVPFFTYYIIIATLLLIVGVILLCFGKKEPISLKVYEKLLPQNTN